MAKKSIKAIVWDLDGTIIRFKIDYIRARRSTIKILKNYGIPKHYLSIKNSILDNIKISREVFEIIDYNTQKIEEIVREINKKVAKIEYEAALKASMIKGIDKVLEFVKEKKLKQAIYTYNTNKNAKTSLEKVNLLHYFDVIAGRDDIDKPKPNPAHLLYICKKLNVDTSEILIIGDNYRDIKGALNVGAWSIAIKTKLSQLSKMEILLKADKIIEEKDIPSELILAIKEFL